MFCFAARGEIPAGISVRVPLPESRRASWPDWPGERVGDD
jgi:hypothetical protein